MHEKFHSASTLLDNLFIYNYAGIISSSNIEFSSVDRWSQHSELGEGWIPAIQNTQYEDTIELLQNMIVEFE